MSDMDSIKQLLSLLIQQVSDLTTQTTELMPLKNVSRDYLKEEHDRAALLVTRLNTLRQLAKTTLDSRDQSVNDQADGVA